MSYITYMTYTMPQMLFKFASTKYLMNYQMTKKKFEQEVIL